MRNAILRNDLKVLIRIKIQHELLSVVLQLVPLRGENEFKPRPKNGILVWVSFQVSDDHPCGVLRYAFKKIGQKPLILPNYTTIKFSSKTSGILIFLNKETRL